MPDNSIIDGGDRPMDLQKAAATGQVSPGLAPERRGHTLTRKGMEQVLKDGGSVMMPDPENPGQSLHVNRVEDLPSEAALAKGNEAAEEAARAAIDAEIARLSADRARIAAPKPEPKPEPPAHALDDDAKKKAEDEKRKADEAKAGKKP